MASARQIVKRRKAVRNVRKITQTMQLIATARFQKCLQRATASQPYTRKITEMIETLASMDSADHFLLRPNEHVKRGIVLAITGNRGLCGPYNAAVLRQMRDHIQALRDTGHEPAVEMVGKKGLNYLRFLRQPVERSITDVEDRIAFARVAEMTERYMRLYRDEEIGFVDVVYTQFVSAGVQRPKAVRLMPIDPPQVSDESDASGRPDFEFSPPPAELLARLIPESVKIRLYQYFNDAIVSEQVARMVAMKAATDAAGDMIKYLTREYNRARQTQITMELADIVGGAEAVQ